ncbi:DUF6286 domain-containing protein [Streptomyces sp. 7-21]|uniref:DUF6286 domain-containing protein n=1 Tax=Streptomyces sp. 7-21 TaxID=2802283 RepID=UPI00191E9348|nr:DUF6286 domain-containing protein [Streptomyces sp. 7-21]MBL1069149.1 hypothetical protein [Streptomyces sp. 7-21]
MTQGTGDVPATAPGPAAPEPPAPEPAAPGRGPEGTEDHGPARRFWSARRVPAALTAAAVLAAVVPLLYDVASVRADRPAAQWRRKLAGELATRPLDDGLVVTVAVAAVLAGLWLIVMAVTPGLRGLLPMRRRHADVRGGIERRAAADVLSYRALEVSGVRAVRISVGRRRVRAWAQASFRDLDDVRADLEAVLAHGLRDLGLARGLALSVQVRRPDKR